MADPRISIVAFASVPPRDQDRGLLGWLSLGAGQTLVLGAVALRCTAGCRLALSFSERRDGNGRRHPVVRQLDDAARQDIEAQVLEALARGAPRGTEAPDPAVLGGRPGQAEGRTHGHTGRDDPADDPAPGDLP